MRRQTQHQLEEWNRQRRHGDDNDDLYDDDDDDMDIDRYSTVISEITTPEAMWSSKDSFENAQLGQSLHGHPQDQQPLRSILRQPAEATTTTPTSPIHSILKNATNPFSEAIGAFDPTAWLLGSNKNCWNEKSLQRQSKLALFHRPSTTFSSGSTSMTSTEDNEMEPQKSFSQPTVTRKYRHKALTPIRSLVASTMSGSSYTNSEECTEDDGTTDMKREIASECRNDRSTTINVSGTTNSQRHRYIQELRDQMMLDKATNEALQKQVEQQQDEKQPVSSMKEQLIQQRRSSSVRNPIRDFGQQHAEPRSLSGTKRRCTYLVQDRHASSPLSKTRGKGKEKRNHPSPRSRSRSRSHSRPSKSTAEQKKVRNKRDSSRNQTRQSSIIMQRDRSSRRGRSRSRSSDGHRSRSRECRRYRSRSSHSRPSSSHSRSRSRSDHGDCRKGSRHGNCHHQKARSSSRTRSKSHREDNRPWRQKRHHQWSKADKSDSPSEASKRKRHKEENHPSKRRHTHASDEVSVSTSISQGSFVHFLSNRKWPFSRKAKSQRPGRRSECSKTRKGTSTRDHELKPELQVSKLGTNMASAIISKSVEKNPEPDAAPKVSTPCQQSETFKTLQTVQENQSHILAPSLSSAHYLGEYFGKDEGVEMIPLINGDGTGGGLLIINADKIQFQGYECNANEESKQSADMVVAPPPLPLSQPTETGELVVGRNEMHLDLDNERDARIPTSPCGIFSSHAVASPTSTVRSTLPFGKHPAMPGGSFPSAAVASPTSTIRHLLPVGKQLDELHDMKVQQLQALHSHQFLASKTGMEQNEVNNIPETALEDVIVAISNFKLQAQKLGLSESKILEVLKDTSTSDTSKKENAHLKTASHPCFVHRQQKECQAGDRLDTTIDVVKKDKGSFGVSTVSSLTYKGPQ